MPNDAAQGLVDGSGGLLVVPRLPTQARRVCRGRDVHTAAAAAAAGGAAFAVAAVVAVVAVAAVSLQSHVVADVFVQIFFFQTDLRGEERGVGHACDHHCPRAMVTARSSALTATSGQGRKNIAQGMR